MSHRPRPFTIIDIGILFLYGMFFCAGSLAGDGTGMLFILFWTAIFGPIFALRRGWIQRWLAAKKQEELNARLNEKKRKAERSQKTSRTAPLISEPSQDSSAQTSNGLETVNEGVFVIKVLPTTKWSPTQAVGLVRALVEKAAGHLLELSIVATQEGVHWEIYFLDEKGSRANLESVSNTVQTYYPEAEVTRGSAIKLEGKRYRKFALFAPRTQYYFGRALSAHDIRGDDPLTSVILAIGNLREGETMRYTVLLSPPFRHSEKEIINLLTVSARDVQTPTVHLGGMNSYGAIVGSIIGNAVSWGAQEYNLRTNRLDRFSPQETERYLQKLTQPLMSVSVWLSMDSPDKARLEALDDAVSAPLSLSGEEVGLASGYTSAVLEVVDSASWLNTSPTTYLLNLAPAHEGDADASLPYIFNLTSDEAAALWHLPHEKTGGGVLWPEPPVPLELIVKDDEAERLVIGSVWRGEKEQRVGILRRDLRSHAFVSGATGTGKSNLLHHFVHQLIQTGQGFVVLDPHELLIKDIIQSSVSAGHTDRLLLLDFNRTGYPIPLNPFRTPQEVSYKYAYNVVLWIMKTVYKSQWSVTQMETVIRRTLELVLTDPEATPMDIQRVLTNDNYRQMRLKQALAERRLSIAAEKWWTDEFSNLSGSARQTKSASTLNRLNTFLDGHIEMMTCHPRSLDFKQLIQNNKMVLVNLKGDEVAAEVGSLGAILFAQIYMAAYSLGEIAGDAPPRYYLIIDETHTFVTTALDRMLSESRKYGLSLILSDQWLGQLDDDTRRSIINNKGTTISFAASEDEAPTMSRLYKPHLTETDLINQNIGQAAVRTRYQGKVLPAFRLQTPPPLKALPEDQMVTVHNLWEKTRRELELMEASAVRSWIQKKYHSKANPDTNANSKSGTTLPDQTAIDFESEEDA